MPVFRFTRRRALTLLASLAGGLLPGPAGADPESPVRDQGIGGTGARPTEGIGDEDRGIGGTGVIGTIRRFGSIVVNDLRIAYPDDVAVRIDGTAVSAKALKIGHVVRVVAYADGGGLATRRIDVTSEVVGRVESIRAGSLVVLGQRVATNAVKAGGLSVGDRVAISGLRRPDGVIVASLIEPRGEGASRIVGRVRQEADGALSIGGLRLEGADRALVGQRTLFVGEAVGNRLKVASSEPARAVFVSGLTRISIEAYIGRRGAGITVGSGFDVGGGATGDLPRRGSVRAVLTTGVGSDGRLRVEHLRIDDRLDRDAGNAAAGSGRAPSEIHRMPNRPGSIDRAPGGPDAPVRMRDLDIDRRAPFGGEPGTLPGNGPGGLGSGHPGPGGAPGGVGGPGGGSPGGRR